MGVLKGAFSVNSLASGVGGCGNRPEASPARRPSQRFETRIQPSLQGADLSEVRCPLHPSRPLLTSPTSCLSQGGRGGWSYFGARTPSVPRPTPRPVLGIGVEEGEGRGRGLAVLTSEGWRGGGKPALQAPGAPGAPAEKSGFGRPWAAVVAANWGTTIAEVSTLGFKDRGPPPSPLLPSRRPGWGKRCASQVGDARLREALGSRACACVSVRLGESAPDRGLGPDLGGRARERQAVPAAPPPTRRSIHKPGPAPCPLRGAFRRLPVPIARD